MKKLYRIISLTVILMCISANMASAQVSGFWVVKTNLNLDLGADLGVTFNDRFGVKVGMMSDIWHPTGDDSEITKKYEEAMGKDYRLSYTLGPMAKVTDWMWVSVTAGYGEYGFYDYSNRLEMYGIREKIKGLEVGLQLNFDIGDCFILAGYGTVPKGFSLDRPLHDISIGIGMSF